MKRIKFSLMSSILIFIFIGTLTVYAELIDGPANVRSEPQGRKLIQFNDNVLVDSSKCVDNWYNIGLTIYFDRASYKDGKIAENSILYDAQGNQIGVTLTDLAPSPWVDVKYDEDLDRYYYFFHGYTYKDNIKENSTVEDMLVRTLTENQNDLLFASLKQHIAKYGYDHWFSDGNFKSYIYYEFSVGLFSGGVRLILFFHNEELVAILHHRDLDYPLKDKTTIRGYNFGYTINIETTIKEQLEAYYFPIITNAD